MWALSMIQQIKNIKKQIMLKVKEYKTSTNDNLFYNYVKLKLSWF